MSFERGKRPLRLCRDVAWGCLLMVFQKSEIWILCESRYIFVIGPIKKHTHPSKGQTKSDNIRGSYLACSPSEVTWRGPPNSLLCGRCGRSGLRTPVCLVDPGLGGRGSAGSGGHEERVQASAVGMAWAWSPGRGGQHWGALAGRGGQEGEGLTARIPPQDELPDLIVDEDEEAVGEGAEPPSDPAGKQRWGRGGVRGHPWWSRKVGFGDQNLAGPCCRHTHLSGYMRRATPMPGQ